MSTAPKIHTVADQYLAEIRERIALCRSEISRLETLAADVARDAASNVHQFSLPLPNSNVVSPAAEYVGRGGWFAYLNKQRKAGKSSQEASAEWKALKAKGMTG